MKRSTRITLVTILIDFLLLIVAVLSMQGIKREIMVISPLYSKLFMIFFISWVLVSIGMKKFRGINERRYYDGLILLGKSNLLMAFLISFAVVGLHLMPASRIQTFGTCVMLFLLESLAFSFFHYKLEKTGVLKPHADIRKSVALRNISYPLLVIDGLLLLAAFFVMTYIKRGSFVMLPRYNQIFMVIVALWLSVSVITSKFDRRNFVDFYNSFFPCVKSAAIMAAILSSIVPWKNALSSGS